MIDAATVSIVDEPFLRARQPRGFCAGITALFGCNAHQMRRREVRVPKHHQEAAGRQAAWH